MRKLLILFIFSVMSLRIIAQEASIVVDSTVLHTWAGVGGMADKTYGFAKGDKIVIVGKSTKMLDRMVILEYPNNLVDKKTDIKKINYEFIMKSEGFITFRFYNDRPGKCNIAYVVSRTPESKSTRDYNTRVEWVRSEEEQNGAPIPIHASK